MRRRRNPDDDSSAELRQRRHSRTASSATRPSSSASKVRKHSLAFLLTAGLAVTLAAALVGGTLTVYFKERSFWESIKRIQVGDLGNRPPKLNSAVNILVIGSDTRKGKNAKIGGYTPGQRSDTTMVLHISPGGRHIVVISLPRDSAVPIYQCDAVPGFSGQQAQPGQVEQLNATFAFGGPACLWKTIEHTTQIRLDDFIQIDFAGFVHIINTLGGVQVCLPYPVSGLQYDPGLHLSAGLHHIWGSQALAFWRAREGLGLGSDLQRIRRDQLLMISLVHGLLRSGVLTSLTRTIGVVNAAASAMTTDTGLTQAKMVQLAESLRGIAAHQVEFIEVPVVAYQPNPNWVQWTAEDSLLFSAIRRDAKLPTSTKHHGKSKPAPKLLSPAKVTVRVLNGSGTAGVAATAATALTSRGFTVTGTGDAPNFSYTTSVVQYGQAADLKAAETVAAQLGHVTIQQASGVKAGTVELILGSTYTALKPALLPSTGPGSVGALSGQYGGLTGSANVCKASKPAFAG